MKLQKRFSNRAYYDLGTILSILIVGILTMSLIPASWPIKAVLGIVLIAILLWIFEPVHITYTSIFLIVLLVVSQAVSFEEAISGFGSGGFTLMIAGFMLAKGVCSTNLGNRLTKLVFRYFGSSIGKITVAIILLPQILVFFIPSVGVRAAILLPLVLEVIKSIEKNEPNPELRRLLILALVLGCDISGVIVIPGAIANIITVDFLDANLGVQISYFKWILLVWPIWLLSIFLLWTVLYLVYGRRIKLSEGNLIVFNNENKPLDHKEIKCLIILVFIICLWFTQSIHMWHPAIPALIGVLLLAAPGIGIISWEELLQINWGPILLLGATLSLSRALVISGSAGFIAQNIISLETIPTYLSISWLAPSIITMLTMLVHLAIANHAPTAATLLPIVMELGEIGGLNTLVLCLTAGISSLFGLTLIVQSPSAVVAYSTGYFTAKDMALIGTCISVAAILIIGITINFWWPIIGFN